MNKTFAIYWAALTIGMLLYYVIVIALDLLKKDKKGRDDVEEFVVGDESDDTPSEVSMVDGRIQFGDREEEATPEESPADGADDSPADDDQDEGDGIFDAPEEETAFDDFDESAELTEDQYNILRQQMESNMEPQEPEYQYVYDSAAFHTLMGYPKGVSSPIKRTFNLDEES